MLILSLLLIFVVPLIQCFTPNCVPENQFRNFGFPVEACSEYFSNKCKSHPKGYFKSLGDAPLVKIGETAVVPTCAFFNVPSLRRIYGVNSKIKVLATGSFINLPDLEGIHLAFNQITEVRKDIFKNISTELLDLSWNEIAFIDSYAFKGISNLKYLNLSRNSLQTLSINHLARTVLNLNLAYNLLETFAINSESFANLTSVDVSNNAVKRVAISFQYPTEKLDLTNNRIRNFDYIDIHSVEKFKMGKNLFEDAPQYLENINAQEIEIYPNPWKCDKLFVLWETLVSFNIRLAPKVLGQNPAPECFDGENRLVTATRSTDCLGDHDCPPFMACRAKKCWDPCDEGLCHNSSVCETKDHVFKCSCGSGLFADPMDIYAECHNVECFADNHCANSYHCVDEKCIRKSSYGHHGGHGHGGYGGGHGHGGYGHRYSSTTAAPPVPWWFEDIPNVVPPSSSKKVATGDDSNFNF